MLLYKFIFTFTFNSFSYLHNYSSQNFIDLHFVSLKMQKILFQYKIWCSAALTTVVDMCHEHCGDGVGGSQLMRPERVGGCKDRPSSVRLSGGRAAQRGIAGRRRRRLYGRWPIVWGRPQTGHIYCHNVINSLRSRLKDRIAAARGTR